MKSAARLIDTHARRFDVTDTRVVLVDASPAAVHAAGERLADRLVLAPTRLESRNGEEQIYGMAARLDGAPDHPGYVKVIWDVRVEPGPESGTTLSMTTRFVSTNRSSRESLRTAWACSARSRRRSPTGPSQRSSGTPRIGTSCRRWPRSPSSPWPPDRAAPRIYFAATRR
jgi:hypothetical protein